MHNIKAVSQKQKYFWNTMGSLCSAFSTVIMLLLVNRILGSEDGGIFSLAYTNAQLMFIIGSLEVRPVQSTDIMHIYPFSTYFTLRVFSCIAMMCVCFGYVYIAGFEREKMRIIIAFSSYKMIEAFADVFGGMYQQNDRIDLTGKVLSVRIFLSTIAFGVIILLTKQLFAGALAMNIVSFMLIIFYDMNVLHSFPDARISLCFAKTGKLLAEVLPLFISMFIMSYISNAPKYAIDFYCSYVLQNKYNILFMPAFVINLFSMFFFLPALVDMTKRWNRHDLSGIKNYIKKSVYLIIIVTFICILGSISIGIPVLSFFYNVNLSGDRFILALVMVYGGLSAFATYFYYVITVIRMQRKILAGYVGAFILVTVLSPLLVKKAELLGAVIASIISLAVLNFIFLIIMVRAICVHQNVKGKTYNEI